MERKTGNYHMIGVVNKIICIKLLVYSAWFKVTKWFMPVATTAILFSIKHTVPNPILRESRKLEVVDIGMVAVLVLRIWWGQCCRHEDSGQWSQREWWWYIVNLWWQPKWGQWWEVRKKHWKYHPSQPAFLGAGGTTSCFYTLRSFLDSRSPPVPTHGLIPKIWY